jgi:O-antigen/teichoic acid export membrane protein
VKWLGVYALLTGPLAANGILWVYYLKRGQINYRFSFDRHETMRLMKFGIILQLSALVFWGFRLADRTVIASMLSREQLGLYTYAVAFITFGLALPTDFGNVLQPILWREAGKVNSIARGFADTKRVAVYVALGTSILIPVAQLVYFLLMNLITVKYVGSIAIFNVLSYNLYLAAIVVIPNLILTSSIVNKQNALYVYIWWDLH